MLDALALAAAAFNILYALLLAWGLDQEGHADRPWKSALALAFVLAAAAALYAVTRVLDDGANGWLAVTAGPPLLMLLLLAVDRDAIWGNFPPPRAARAFQRVAAVVVFALPGLLAWAATG